MLQPNFKQRVSRLQGKLAAWKVGGILLSASDGFDANTYYYSGDQTHPTMLFITRDGAAIVSLHAEDFGNTFDNCIPLAGAREKLRPMLKCMEGALGVDDYSPFAGGVFRSAAKARKRTVTLGEKLEQMRLVKDDAEKQRVRAACRITKNVLELNSFAGKTENHVAGEMELIARKNGASLDAFTPMVLAGERAAFFHNTTSNRRICAGEPVLIDTGCRVEFYCADYTRTYANGCRSKKFIDALEAVRQSKDAAMRKAKPGADVKSLGDIAEKIIAEHGFKDHSFRKVGLALGHHVGLNVHDGRMNEGKLKKGNCVTIEPGIYVPGEFGVRIEDTVIL